MFSVIIIQSNVDLNKSDLQVQCTPEKENTGNWSHNCDVIMNTIASQITSLTIVYLTVNSGIDQRKHQSSASLAFVRGIHRRPVNSPHKGPVTRKMFPFDDVIMAAAINQDHWRHWSCNWLCQVQLRTRHSVRNRHSIFGTEART